MKYETGLRPSIAAVMMAIAAWPAFAAETQPANETAAPATEAVLPDVSVDASAEEENRYQPLTTKTAAKIEAELRDIPQTVNVVPEKLYEDQGARSLNDVLRNVPGVGFSNGDGQRDQVTIRGFSAIADQFIDGGEKSSNWSTRSSTSPTSFFRKSRGATPTFPPRAPPTARARSAFDRKW